MVDEATFHAIFRKYELILQATNTKSEEYVPEQVVQHEEAYPTYVPTPRSAGPKAITIEEYKRRQEARKRPTTPVNPPPKKKPNRRRGKAFRQRKQIAQLYERYNLATTVAEKKNIKLEIKDLRRNRNKKN
ncbi:uncharacterized protein LOC119664673 [Teleopsis dalmanni]|uniref:uncharacterized protein LOC119663883 n=1 Tax=Teleopsis dalmanni TaxID=139649 RepID=UPI0018CF366A|nr:uncharacterized protein LOC119663883 [Teleopsis dalmanni]XP_037930055.1 uncharacterized protein LOC119664673 [Teleopsis dalmanni]